MNSKILWSVLPLAFAIGTPVIAQDSGAGEEKLIEELIVSSARVPTPIIDQNSSVSVLTSADLQVQAYDTLGEHLRTQPGVTMRRNGGIGSITTVQIRGESGYRTRLVVDDMLIADPSAPQMSPTFDDILVDGIERVEILRGPQGMVHGADAGGVVSVYTQSAIDGVGASVSARVGSDGYQKVSGFGGIGGDSGFLMAHITGVETDGFNTRDSDTSGERDGYDNQTIYLRGALNITESLQAGFNYRQHDAELDYDQCFNNSFGFTNACASEPDIKAGRVYVAYDGEVSNQSIALSQTDVTRDNFADDDFTFGGEGKVTKAEYLGEFSKLGNLSLVYGLDYEEQENTLDDTARDQLGAHAALLGEISSGTTLNVGLRYDDNEDFGDFTNYRVALGQRWVESDTGILKLRGQINSGFRAPSLFEQGYNDGLFGNGIQLSEETSIGYELGLDWFGDNGLYAGATVFQQEIEDEILFDNVAFTGYLQTEGQSESSGIELETKWQLSEQFRFAVNYTFNETETADGQDRIRRPKHLANIGVTWSPLTGLSISPQLRIARDAMDIGAAELDDQDVFDLALSYQLMDGLTVSANVENLLDDDYQETVGFNNGGRRAFASIQWSLN